MRSLAKALPLALAVLAGANPAVARAGAGIVTSERTHPRTRAGAGAHAASTNSEALSPLPLSSVAPPAHRLSPDEVLAIADRLPKMRAVRAAHPGSFGDTYLKGALQWQVSYFSKDGKQEIGLVVINDDSGRVVEQWTGYQIAWSMARGYPGAFGRHVNALYIWLPLCLLFIAPFVNPRRPFSLLHLDLLVLLSFSVSLAFFNHAHIYASVPLAYPPLLYLLARMLALTRRGRSRRPGGPGLRLLVPVSWLAFGVVFLLGFRIALNVTDSNVIDVGYAGVIGASRITHDQPLYGGWPAENEHGDTYAPANYEAYLPFEQLFGWSGTWDDLPAAHAAAIFFDLLATALMFLLGRRLRGPTFGVVLAYAWVAYPFTLFSLESNSDDTLVGALVLGALLLASLGSRFALAGRGALSALAGLTKFAPLALAPLFATYAPGASRVGRARTLALFTLAFLATAALVFIPALRHDSLHEIYERTLVYQSNRGSPFSVWGLYGLHSLEPFAEAAAALLALVLALAVRPGDLIALAAACAAVLIAEQLAIEHWFYLYIPWFFGALALALLGDLSAPAPPPRGAASGPARSSRLAAVASS